MKTLIMLTLLFCAGQISFAQDVSPNLPVDPATSKVTFAKIVDAPGTSSKDLFQNAKKFLLTKNTSSNPFTIKYENMQEGSIISEGTFTLPAARRKYLVRFAFNVSTKDGKYKYSLSDIIIQFHTDAKSSYGGYGGWGSSTHKNAETLEYTVETFYPSRLNSKDPVIKFFEEIDEDSFVTIHRELKSFVSSFRQAMTSKDNW